MKTVIGVFDTKTDAENAIAHLRDEGFEPADISVVMRDREEAKDMAQTTGATVAEGAVSGLTTGAVLGGLTGLLAGTVLPGLGALLIGGPLAASLGLTGAAATTVSGAATGALAGGLIGALTGLGLSEDEAKTYEKRIRQGAILLAVPTLDGDETEVSDIFSDHRVSDMTIVRGKDENTQEYDEAEEVDYSTRPAFATVGRKGGRRRTTKAHRKLRHRHRDGSDVVVETED